MTKNMGTADRTIRTLLALTVGVLYLTAQLVGPWPSSWDSSRFCSW